MRIRSLSFRDLERVCVKIKKKSPIEWENARAIERRADLTQFMQQTDGKRSQSQNVSQHQTLPSRKTHYYCLPYLFFGLENPI